MNGEGVKQEDGRKIRVLAVDDSALMRRLLTDMVNAEPDMEMVATAPDPLVARDLIKRHTPDVITLDVEMPHMDGLDFLERLMRLRPMPVVMVSTLTQRGSEITLRALELGAVDFVAKPGSSRGEGMEHYAQRVADKLRAAAQSKPRRLHVGGQASPMLTRRVGAGFRLIAIGASTGGTEAIRQVLEPLPADMPPIVITQHMPAGFTHSFAERLDRLCRLHVKEAEHGEPLRAGTVYIAPGSHHLRVLGTADHWHLALDDGEPVNRHRPSVDSMFESLKRFAGPSLCAVILTGMGRDGAREMLALRRKGAMTIGQDEASSVVYGMPREAAACGAIARVLPIGSIAGALLEPPERGVLD